MANVLYDALIRPHAESTRVFLEIPGAGDLTFKDFAAMAARYAHVFTDAGVVPGDRLAMQIEKSPEALAVVMGCIQAGIVFLPLNTGYTAAEIEYFVGDATPKILVCDPKNADALTQVAARHDASVLTLDAGGKGSLPDAATGKPDTFDTIARTDGDLAAFLYTSGTTGRSKGAMLTHRNLLSNAEVLKEYWRFSAEDVLLHALPIFHTHGLFVATNICLLAGARMIFLPAFKPDAMIDGLSRATSMMGVPTFYTRLLDDPRLTRDLVSHMRLFVSGSAPLLAETHVQFEDRTGHRILERYGMTETNMNTSNPYDAERRAGTVGFPLPGVDLRIVDPESGEALDGDAVGSIEVKGENVFIGYWQMPEKTAADFREDGFFITGDLGKMDADGYVHIVGRSKDLIISGGYNIYPKEVELLLDDQPGVKESAVIGVPHPDFGEGVVGVLVAEDDGLDTDAIASSIRDGIARFKQPKALFVVDALPRNTMGKVQKNVLRDRYKDLFKG